MKPSIGRIVHFTINAQDATAINKRRRDFREHQSTDAGYIAHVGNGITEGQVYPAMIVRVWSEDLVQLQVFLDGNDTYWATSVHEGNESTGHTWFWPPRV